MKSQLQFSFALGLGALLLWASSGKAVPLVVSNHSFETPDLTTGNSWSNANPDWGDDAGGSGDEFNEFISGFAADGVHHVGVQAGSELAQTLTDTYQAGVTYVLTVAVGHRDGFHSNEAAGGSTSIELRDDADTVLAAILVDANTIAAGTFQDFSVSYLATGSEGAIRIGLNNLGGAGTSNPRSHFDNVRLNAVPEPTTLMLGLGAIALSQAVWRRRNS